MDKVGISHLKHALYLLSSNKHKKEQDILLKRYTSSNSNECQVSVFNYRVSSRALRSSCPLFTCYFLFLFTALDIV